VLKHFGKIISIYKLVYKFNIVNKLKVLVTELLKVNKYTVSVIVFVYRIALSWNISFYITWSFFKVQSTNLKFFSETRKYKEMRYILYTLTKKAITIYVEKNSVE